MAGENNDPIVQVDPAAASVAAPPDVAPIAAEAPPAAEPAPAAADATPPSSDATGAPNTGLPPSLLDEHEAKNKPAADPAPAVDAKPDEGDAKPAEETPPTDAKPEEKEKVAEEPKPEDAPVEEPKPEGEETPALEAIDYFAEETGIKLPETLALDETQRGELTAALDTFRADPTKGAQALVDLHAKLMGEHQQRLEAGQWDAFRETIADWRKQAMADPILGGAGHDTAMAKVAAARDGLVSTHKPGTPAYEKDKASFVEFMRVTGAGDHPAFLRFMHNASRFVREAQPGPIDGLPPKDLGKDPSRKGKKISYTHPTSNADS